MTKLYFFYFIFGACIALNLSAQDAKPTENTALKSLKNLGFYVYDKPLDLPQISLTNIDGKIMSNKDFSGKIVFLNFWATWCPPCRSEMPSIETLNSKMKNENFSIIAVNVSEKKQTVSKFITTNKYTFPIYIDENGILSRTFATRGIPITYILNKNGKIIAVRPGAMFYDDGNLIKIFKELANE